MRRSRMLIYYLTIYNVLFGQYSHFVVGANAPKLSLNQSLSVVCSLLDALPP